MTGLGGGADSQAAALIVDEAPRCIAAAEFLARRGIKVPEQVSRVSTETIRR